VSTTIKSTRRSQGITVTELAARLGVTPSAITQLEKSEADGTIKLNSLTEALSAMSATLRLSAGAENAMSDYAPYRVAEALSSSLIEKANPAFTLRLLTEAVQQISQRPQECDATDLEIAPTPLPEVAWDTLMRALYAQSIPGRKPSWTKTNRLPEPWFVSQFPSMRERAKATTPDYLKRLNIFIDARSLERA